MSAVQFYGAFRSGVVGIEDILYHIYCHYYYGNVYDEELGQKNGIFISVRGYVGSVQLVAFDNVR